MRFFQGRKTKDKGEASEAFEPASTCPHTTLIPRWDSVADMGNAERITQFICESCGASLSREEGERVRSDGARRMKLDEDMRIEEDAKQN